MLIQLAHRFNAFALKSVPATVRGILVTSFVVLEAFVGHRYQTLTPAKSRRFWLSLTETHMWCSDTAPNRLDVMKKFVDVAMAVSQSSTTPERKIKDFK